MKTYKLIIKSWNVTTTINVDLTPAEYKLMKDINASLVKQKAENILDVVEAWAILLLHSASITQTGNM